MNEQGAPQPSLHIPFTVLALAILVLLISQLTASYQQEGYMKWQSGNLEKSIANYQTNQKRLADLIEKRKTPVEQSGQLQAKLQNLANDLLNLSKDDEDAKKIVQKWNIQRQNPPAADPKEK